MVLGSGIQAKYHGGEGRYGIKNVKEVEKSVN